MSIVLRFVIDFLVDNLESIAFWASVVVAFGGTCALLAVSVFWSRLSRHYQEAWAKIAIAFFRAVAALSALAAKSAPSLPDKSILKQPWAATIGIAALGYLLWEIAGAVGDQRFKRLKDKTAEEHQDEIDELKETHAKAIANLNRGVEEANQDRDDAELGAIRLNWVLTHLRGLANEKLQRVRLTVAGGGRATIQLARQGLDPEEQVRVLLEGLASLFRYAAIHADPNSFNQNFRVGLFAERDGHLEPLDAFDMATRNHDPFSSYRLHAERFRLDNNANPSHAVRCVREGKALIVEDCATAPGFEFFNDRQRKYLRSIIAYPLSGFCADGVNQVSAALLVDTDVPGFFREEDREILELLLREFATRIDLEYAINGLTH
jgi:hypothetical protein